MAGNLVMNAPRSGRSLRRPRHPFQVTSHPFTLTPFMIAPVLPGETMRNLLFQARVVTDPIKNALIGWWCGHYFFYVKLRDLDGRDTYENMVLDMTQSTAALNSAASQYTYHRAGNDYVAMCLKRVCEEYFRAEGEAWNLIVDADQGYPIVKIKNESWYDSVISDADIPTDFIDQTPTVDVPFKDLEGAYRTWEFMRQMSVINATFEDYLRMHGVSVRAAELHKPELLRWTEEWTYPTNTVDPLSGTPSSACSWSIQERADKDRFFSEPGFIFGVTCIRPKVYFHQQRGAAVSMLDNAFAWLPAIMRNDKATSLRKIDNAVGPVEDATSDYWVDIRDLFLYGDQYHNRGDSSVDANYVELPTAAWQRDYIAGTEASYNAFFSDQTAGAGGKRYVRQDGVVSLAIATMEGSDFTPSLSSAPGN